MTFLALPLKNLRRHKVRSALTALGIAIALAGMLALVGLSRGLERSWIYFLEGKGTHILALQKGSIDALAAALDEKLAVRLGAVEGVATVTAGLGEMVDLESGQMVLLAGWPLASDFWTRLTLTEGKAPGASDPESVVLGEALAKAVGKRPGDSIQLGGRDFRIAGISRQAGVLDDRSVMIPMAAMQQLVGREGKASGFHIRVARAEEPGAIDRVRDRLASAFPSLTFTLTSEVTRDTLVLRLLRAIAWSSSTIALGMALVAVLNTLLMAVIEKTREFGLLSAVGWHPARVMALVILDGLLLSAAGSVAGVAMGLACLRWIAAHPRLGGLFQPEVTAGLIGEAVGLALLVGLLGGLYPAWRATRLNPMELLRGE